MKGVRDAFQFQIRRRIAGRRAGAAPAKKSTFLGKDDNFFALLEPSFLVVIKTQRACRLQILVYITYVTYIRTRAHSRCDIFEAKM